MKTFKNIALAMVSMIFVGSSFGQVINTFPFVEDFESQPLGPTGCGAVYTFTGTTWMNGDDATPPSASHQNDWTVDEGGTGSLNTGPSVDHTLGSATGNYIYCETSCNNTGYPNRTFELISPYLDMTSLANPGLDFWYHAFGATQGQLNVEASVGSGGAWTNLTTLNDNIDLWQNQTLNLITYAGQDSVRIRFRYVSGTSFTGDIALDDISVFNILPLDAGISSIDNIINPVPLGPLNVDATVYNYGSDTLLNATVEWSVDGAPQTPYAWTGYLGYQQTDPAVNIGSYSVTPGLHRIKAWTTAPNGGTDGQNPNDTSEIVICTALVGNYTVGGVGADFTDMVELGNILSSCGVSGHVNVTVNPGTYAGGMILDHVPGTADTATITIDGIDASLVTMTTSALSNIYFNGTDWVTVKNITLENIGTTDAYGIQLRDTSSFNVFDSLRIIMAQAPGASDIIGVSASNSTTSSFSEGQNALWTTVSNCYIFGGEKGIHFEGQSVLRNVGNRFINNTIEGPEDYGFYLDDQDSLVIMGNTVTGITSNTGDGIYCFDIQEFDISYNSVMNVPDWAIYIADGNYSLDGGVTSRGRISNNMASSQTDYAAYFDDTEQTDIFHNTFYGNPGMRINDFSQMDIRNNIFRSDNDYAFESDETVGVNDSLDYNAYWTPTSNTLFVKDGATTYANLTLWQAGAPTFNANSIEADPFFLNGLNDLHVLSTAVNDLGDNTVGIADDIDGDSRPAGVNVDMGADEFTPVPDNLWLVDYILPGACGDSNAPIYMVVTNLGVDTAFTFDATINMTGDATQTLNYTYNDTLTFYETDTIMVGTLNTYWGVNFNIDGWVTIAGDADNTNDSLSTTMYILPFEPVVYPGYACGDTSTWLTAQDLIGADYNWFASSDQVNDTIPVASGDSLFVPNANPSVTFYVEYADNADSLVSTYAGGNGCGGGNMFDLTAINTINWRAVSVNTSAGAGTPINCNVWYIPNGTYVGSETNGGAWTLLGNFTGISAGDGNPTYVDFTGTDLLIPAGSTYGIYVEFPANYTNGSNTYANADLSIQTGVGLCGSFSGVNNPRSFNGAIHYGTTACSNIRVPVTASVEQFADPSYTATPTGAGNVVDFASSGATQNTGYSWNFGDGSPVDTNPNPQHTFAPDSTYVICLTATSLCGDSTWCDSMDICETMAGSFSYTTTTGYDYNFTDNTSGTPISWSWDFGDGNSSTAQNPSHTYASIDSNYTVTLTVWNYCGDSVVETQSLAVVNVGELTLDNAVNVSPNPSDGLYIVDFIGEATGNVEMTIVDQQGRLVLSQTINEGGQWTKEVDLRAYADGIYFMKLAFDDAVVERKLVKTKK